ncbi:MAG TPA: GPP34 family phosphoprotein [Streptosporangiaceae bacterium]|jgi:hypothetical protein
MDPPASGPALAALGEDLFLLSIRARDGKLMTRRRIDSALMGSELVRLAAAGRAWISEGRIAVRDRAATGDTELDAALAGLAGAPFPPRPETWVGLPRPGIRDAYAARLIAAGVLRLEPGRLPGTARYHVTDAPRAAAARSRLDAATQAHGGPAGPAPAALAGLGRATGLAGVVYPGRDGQPRRARMAEIARQQVIARTAAGPDLAARPATEEAIAAAVQGLTLVFEGGAILGAGVTGSRVAGRQRPAFHWPAVHGGGSHDAGSHGQGHGHGHGPGSHGPA